MIAELIPSTAITAHDGNVSLFRAMDTANDEGDIITMLEGSQWKQYYYDESHGNTAITKAHIIGTRRPLDASDNNLTGTFTMDGNDFLIDDGTVSNIQSCDANGAGNEREPGPHRPFLGFFGGPRPSRHR